MSICFGRLQHYSNVAFTHKNGCFSHATASYTGQHDTFGKYNVTGEITHDTCTATFVTSQFQYVVRQDAKTHQNTVQVLPRKSKTQPNKPPVLRQAIFQIIQPSKVEKNPLPLSPEPKDPEFMDDAQIVWSNMQSGLAHYQAGQNVDLKNRQRHLIEKLSASLMP